jgi:hypothetical protein
MFICMQGYDIIKDALYPTLSDTSSYVHPDRISFVFCLFRTLLRREGISWRLTLISAQSQRARIVASTSLQTCVYICC